MEADIATAGARTRQTTAAPSLLAALAAAFSDAREEGMPKHAVLRKAVLACVELAVLSPGDKLPSEQTLAAALGLSLGTVRRALAQLAATHVLLREHGHGTFVADAPQAIDDHWHFRFFDRARDTLLPIYSTLVGRQLVREDGEWTQTLGPDPKGFVVIRRAFDIDRRFLCYSEMHLPSSRFGALMKRPSKALNGVNLKGILATEFGAPTLYVKQRGCVELLPDRVCKHMGVAPKTAGMMLRLVGYTFNDRPISHHKTWIPPTRELMDLATVWPDQRGAGTVHE